MNFTCLERCRLTFWRETTGSPSPHTRVIIARAECDYRAPASFGDELDVRLNVGEIGRSSCSLVYEIAHAVTGGLVATGKTVMVSYDHAAGRAVPLPDAARTLLKRMKGSDGGPDRRKKGAGDLGASIDPRHDIFEIVAATHVIAAACSKYLDLGRQEVNRRDDSKPEFGNLHLLR